MYLWGFSVGRGSQLKDMPWRHTGAGREMAAPPTSPFDRPPPSSPPPLCFAIVHLNFSVHLSLRWVLHLTVTFFYVFHSMTSNMAPAHPHAPGEAMFQKLFQCSNFYLQGVRPGIHIRAAGDTKSLRRDHDQFANYTIGHDE